MGPMELLASTTMLVRASPVASEPPFVDVMTGSVASQRPYEFATDPVDPGLTERFVGFGMGCSHAPSKIVQAANKMKRNLGGTPCFLWAGISLTGCVSFYFSLQSGDVWIVRLISVVQKIGQLPRIAV